MVGKLEKGDITTSGFSCIYTSLAGGAVLLNISAPGPAFLYQWGTAMKAAYKDAETVSGVGEEAYWVEKMRQLWIRKGDLILNLTGTGVSSWNRDTARELALKVVAR